jgi:hypothetical protein
MTYEFLMIVALSALTCVIGMVQGSIQRGHAALLVRMHLPPSITTANSEVRMQPRMCCCSLEGTSVYWDVHRGGVQGRFVIAKHELSQPTAQSSRSSSERNHITNPQSPSSALSIFAPSSSWKCTNTNFLCRDNRARQQAIGKGQTATKMALYGSSRNVDMGK